MVIVPIFKNLAFDSDENLKFFLYINTILSLVNRFSFIIF